jgi:hypothetical protein
MIIMESDTEGIIFFRIFVGADQIEGKSSAGAGSPPRTGIIIQLPDPNRRRRFPFRN